MGGYSSDSDSDRERSKKKSRRRRSSSSSSETSYHSKVSSKSQKEKSRSKRDSPDRRYHSKNSRSRSHSKDRKTGSRSSSTHSYSSSSRNRHARRSRSRSRDRKDVKESKRDSSSRKGHSDDTSKRKHGSSSSFVPPAIPHEARTPEEQLKLKMQLALKAAADADAALRQQGILPGKGKEWNLEQEEEKPLVSSRLPQLSGIEQMDRAKALDAINAPGFQQAAFKTGSKNLTSAQVDNKFSLGNHDAAMFGIGTDPNIPGLDGFGTAGAAKMIIDKDCIAHENLFVDPAIKEDRWIKKLMFMRQRKLNGEAMMF